MSEIIINFGAWEDAINDIDSNILGIYDSRMNHLEGIKNNIANLYGDYGYKWPAHAHVESARADVQSKKEALESFKKILEEVYEYVLEHEDELAERLYCDSNSFMNENGITPEYEKGIFEKLWEAIATGYRDIGEILWEGIVWLWDSGIIQLVGEVIIAVAAVATFIACFPVSGFLGVMTAIGLGWGASKAIADVVADSVSVVCYMDGDKEAAEEWADRNMQDAFNAGAEWLNDATGAEFFDEAADVLYIALDVTEFATGGTEFGNWKNNLNNYTNLNTLGVVADSNNTIHQSNRVIKFLTGGNDVIDYTDFKNLKKYGKMIAEFPDKGPAALTNILKDDCLCPQFKNLDKLINFAEDPLSIITNDLLADNGYITNSTAASVNNSYSDIKTVKDTVKNMWISIKSGGTIGNNTFNPMFGGSTSLGYTPTLGDVIGFDSLFDGLGKLAN